MASLATALRRRAVAPALAAALLLAATGCWLSAFVAAPSAQLPAQLPSPRGLAAAAPAQAPGDLAAGGLAVAGLAAAAAAALAAARRDPRSQRASSRPSAVALAAEAESAEWFPRTTGWGPQDLAAERQRVQTLAEPDSSYSGPRYTGRGSITSEWVASLIAMQEKGGLLPKKDAFLMVLDIIDILKSEGTLNDVSIPAGKHVTVVGDLHGQYWDFMNILKLAGHPAPDKPFVFNGDFVDRGSWSIEVIMVLFAFKLKDPGSVHLNRGNHEMLETNILYGFCGECGAKYDMALFDLFSEAFRNLPLAHLVQKKVLVLHAGLPGPDPRIWLPGQTHDPTDAIPMGALATLDDMRACDRYMEVSPEDYSQTIGPSTDSKEMNDMRLLIDMIWSDPRGGDGYGPSYRKGKGTYMFGPNITSTFCERNNVQFIVRSHEVKADGYRWDHPQLISVFSAPNYLDTGNNKGAFAKLTCAGPDAPVEVETVSYTAVPHPDLPPMHWQENIMENYPLLTRKMKKKIGATSFDEFGDSDFEGIMNFDEWEPDEAEAFQEAANLDMYGREIK